jgi:uncharacterized protein YbcI
MITKASDGREPHSDGELAAAIATEVVHRLGVYTGRGPTKARAHVDRDVVTVLLHDAMTKSERHLVSGGHAAAVLQTRSVIQELMRPELVAFVEDLMGRRVMAFMSANHIDPDMAVETFVLAPD